MRVLVTGGSGFIGSNIARSLLRQKHKVFILDDFSHASFKNILNLDCEVIVGDILDDNVYKKLPKVDAVIHEAAITDTTLKDDRRMMMVNFYGFKKILNYCLKKKIRLVYASSAGVYGNGSVPMKEEQKLSPLNTYAYSKYLCDREINKFKNKTPIPIVGLRYFNVYGPGEFHKGKSSSMIYQLYLQIRNNKRPKLFKHGEQKRDFVYIKDVVEATIKALKVDRVVVLNVGTGKAHSFNDVVGIINEILDKSYKPQYIDNPYEEVYQNYTWADMSKTKRILNFSPRYSLKDGIAEYIEELEQR